MRRILGLSLFLTVFLGVLLSSSLFLFSSIWNYLGLDKNLIYYIVVLASTVHYPVATVLEKIHFNKVTKGIYFISSMYLGIFFLGLSYTALFKFLDIFLRINYPGQTIILLTLVTTVYAFYNSHILKINRINLFYNKSILKKETKIVHMSDIHIGTINTRKYLQKLVNKTNKENPDLVMITGDLVDGSAPITKEMLSPINKIKAPVYFCIGNHEIYDNLTFVIPILKTTKMKILRNESTNLKDIRISGIDFYEGEKIAKKEIKNLNLDNKKFNILLNHPPTAFETAEKMGVNLQLSGHTHFGQIFPFNFLVKMSYKRISGIYKEKDSYLFVSNGSGTWGPPMRLGSKSEIAVITLRRKN